LSKDAKFLKSFSLEEIKPSIPESDEEYKFRFDNQNDSSICVSNETNNFKLNL